VEARPAIARCVFWKETIAEGGEWCFTSEGSVASSPEPKLKAPKLRVLEHKAHSDWKRQRDEGEGKGMVPKF